MLTAVPENSRRKIQRTRRAGKIVGRNYERRSGISPCPLSEATASVWCSCSVPNVSIAPAGTPNFKSMWRIRVRRVTGSRPVLTARSLWWLRDQDSYRQDLFATAPPLRKAGLQASTENTIASARLMGSETIHRSAAPRSTGSRTQPPTCRNAG